MNCFFFVVYIILMEELMLNFEGAKLELKCSLALYTRLTDVTERRIYWPNALALQKCLPRSVDS
jgi:hypothetical protein